MKTRYEQNIDTHFRPFANAFTRWQNVGGHGDIPYGQRRRTRHVVWLDEAATSSRDLYVTFDYDDLRAVKTEEDLLALWDVAYAISAVSQ